MPTYEIRCTAHKLNDAPSGYASKPEMATRYLLDNCFPEDELWREKAYALYLDSKSRIIGHLLLSVGGTDSTDIDLRLLAKGALDVMAKAVILAHNHPSGDTHPSQADIRMTDKARKGLSFLGIELPDHIIIGSGAAFSFQEERIFETHHPKKHE